LKCKNKQGWKIIQGRHKIWFFFGKWASFIFIKHDEFWWMQGEMLNNLSIWWICIWIHKLSTVNHIFLDHYVDTVCCPFLLLVVEIRRYLNQVTDIVGLEVPRQAVSLIWYQVEARARVIIFYIAAFEADTAFRRRSSSLVSVDHPVGLLPTGWSYMVKGLIDQQIACLWEQCSWAIYIYLQSPFLGSPETMHHSGIFIQKINKLSEVWCFFF